MKTPALFTIVFSLLTILNSCSQNNSLEEKGLGKYLDTNIVKTLDDCLKKYDSFLNDNYPHIKKEDRTKEFLNDFYNASISDDSNKFDHFIKSFNYFKKEGDSLKTKGFFDFPKENSEIIDKTLQWKNSLQLFNNNSVTDSIHKAVDIKNPNIYNLDIYYFGIYNLAIKENDTLTINWIKSKINTQASFPAIAYISTLPNEYLNSTLCKTMIFTEFILPFYDFKKFTF